MATLAIPSESIELSNPPSGDLSSSSQHDAGIDNGIQDRKGKGRVQSREEHRILAACVGAIVTSLTSKCKAFCSLGNYWLRKDSGQTEAFLA